MKTVGQRLRAARGGLSRAEAANRLKIHPNTLQRYEDDRREPGEDLLRLASHTYGMDFDWLKSGRGMPTSERTDDEARSDSGVSPAHDLEVDLVPVPVLDIRASAGPGQIVNSELPLKAMRVNRALLVAHGVNPDGARLLYGDGDSMAPTILDGDPLIVDVSDREPRDKVFVIRRGDDLLIKRLQRHSDGSLSLISDNPAFGPDRLPRDEADDLEIIARVGIVMRSI